MWIFESFSKYDDALKRTVRIKQAAETYNIESDFYDRMIWAQQHVGLYRTKYNSWNNDKHFLITKLCPMIYYRIKCAYFMSRTKENTDKLENLIGNKMVTRSIGQSHKNKIPVQENKPKVRYKPLFQQQQSTLHYNVQQNQYRKRCTIL